MFFRCKDETCLYLSVPKMDEGILLDGKSSKHSICWNMIRLQTETDGVLSTSKAETEDTSPRVVQHYTGKMQCCWWWTTINQSLVSIGYSVSAQIPWGKKSPIHRGPTAVKLKRTCLQVFKPDGMSWPVKPNYVSLSCHWIVITQLIDF